MERLKLMLGYDAEPEPDPEDEGILAELNQYCTLTRKQRLYGFAGCMSLGLLCSLLSSLVWLNPVKFAITYTFGNLLSLGSTTFLVGPMRQLKMMFDPVRAVATIVYVVAIVLTLFCALYLHDILLTMICIVVEFCAVIWYSLSYIPFARRMVASCLTRCLEVEV
ncbi:Membrane protein involved in ER to Golgi transport [Klebsormidium nitens]|uniref:Vesicle transport protein n=1 Tax=Klebsormidium nitens TaxID=105231 RepID=A0A1Y1IA24_KLENI|nr:Membrane protein involved in ER to Golgi transport [Klebsormidium nitens]|eukprot:GAQ87770.1 Membrane protein involved in ER to Golgi transport [Klebsormidium nitens]